MNLMSFLRNVLFNQIIKTSLVTLMKYKQLEKGILHQLVNISRYFEGIDIIRLEKSHFSRI